MKSNQYRVVKKPINCFHSNIYFPWLLVYLPWLTGILKSPRCDIIYWHYDRGLNNSKLTVGFSITVADGGMRVWHFNGVITTYGKRDCRNYWRYASLAVNRGAIKPGFTVYYKSTPQFCPCDMFIKLGIINNVLEIWQLYKWGTMIKCKSLILR